MERTENLCPACGPVHADASSRYCMDHLQDLLAHCGRAHAHTEAVLTADPMDWLAASSVEVRAA